MNNKPIIEFGLRRTSELFRPQPSASADNADLGLNNSDILLSLIQSLTYTYLDCLLAVKMRGHKMAEI